MVNFHKLMKLPKETRRTGSVWDIEAVLNRIVEFKPCEIRAWN